MIEIKDEIKWFIRGSGFVILIICLSLHIQRDARSRKIIFAATRLCNLRAGFLGKVLNLFFIFFLWHYGSVLTSIVLLRTIIP